MNTLVDPQTEELIQADLAKILVVDDDVDLINILQLHLTRQGFQVVTATTGADGLKKLESESPDLILLDIELPDTTGFDICEQITDDPRTLQIPIIFVSGVEESDVLRRARSAGCSFYMRKPYDPNALLVLIKQALNEAI